MLRSVSRRTKKILTIKMCQSTHPCLRLLGDGRVNQYKGTCARSSNARAAHTQRSDSQHSIRTPRHIWRWSTHSHRGSFSLWVTLRAAETVKSGINTDFLVKNTAYAMADKSGELCDGFKEDCLDLIRTVVAHRSSDFRYFCDEWKRMGFHYVFM